MSWPSHPCPRCRPPNHRPTPCTRRQLVASPRPWNGGPPTPDRGTTPEQDAGLRSRVTPECRVCRLRWMSGFGAPETYKRSGIPVDILKCDRHFEPADWPCRSRCCAENAPLVSEPEDGPAVPPRRRPIDPRLVQTGSSSLALDRSDRFASCQPGRRVLLETMPQPFAARVHFSRRAPQRPLRHMAQGVGEAPPTKRVKMTRPEEL